MASELIAEAITDYFGERCLDYAEGCPTCEAWAEYDRWNTRAAPAATDTGLETVAFQHRRIDKYGVVGDWRPYKRDLFGSDRIESRELVTRSQAEEILAAERARADANFDKVIEQAKRAEKAEADNAAKDARIKELEEEVEWAQNAVLARQRHAEARCEALEAKLAAAEKALETYRSTVKGVCESQRGTKWGKAAECIFDAIERAVLEVKSS